MAEALTAEEQATIESVVSSVHRRSHPRRRSYRRGWGSLVACVLALPILSAAFDGTITMTGAVVRVVLSVAVCWLAADLFGALVDRYQATVAVAAVTDAVARVREAESNESSTTEPDRASETASEHGTDQ